MVTIHFTNSASHRDRSSYHHFSVNQRHQSSCVADFLPQGTAQTIADSTRVPVEAAALLAVAGASGSYARFGSNDDGGHANGLSGWNLGCARFHQYAFLDDDTLQTYVSCITTVDAVIVSSGSTAQLLRTETMQDPLRGYARLVSDKLEEGFDCTRVSAVAICLNRVPNSRIK